MIRVVIDLPGPNAVQYVLGVLRQPCHTWTNDIAAQIERPRPLIVLDLAGSGSLLVSALRKDGYSDIAFQIEAQTKVRPSEPTDPAVRVKLGDTEWAKIGRWWVCADMSEVPREWDYLVDLGVNS